MVILVKIFMMFSHMSLTDRSEQGLLKRCYTKVVRYLKSPPSVTTTHTTYKGLVGKGCRAVRGLLNDSPSDI